MSTQTSLFGLPSKLLVPGQKKGPGKKSNPMLRLGPGPEGKKCKTCMHLVVKQFSKNYYKCRYRGDTNGPGTDHRVNWPACTLYAEDYPERGSDE